ncbi:hypothetical protein VT84_35110 [Gemmata sp. SH-PL17]|nr:hypothetical protein VT84_35110 [Gemmata sp. SH-PL17]
MEHDVLSAVNPTDAQTDALLPYRNQLVQVDNRQGTLSVDVTHNVLPQGRQNVVLVDFRMPNGQPVPQAIQDTIDQMTFAPRH